MAGNSGGQGYRYSSGGTTPPQKNDGGWGEWIAIAVLLCLPFGLTQVIGIIWAISKVSKMSRQRKQKMKDDVRQAADRVARDARQAADRFRQEFGGGKASRPNPSEEPTDRTYTASAQGSYRYVRNEPEADRGREKEKTGRKKMKTGRGMLAVGIIFAALFGLVAFITGVTLCPPAVPLSFMVAALPFVGLIIGGVNRNRTRDRWLSYLAYIGANREVSLAHMSASFGVSIKKLCADLRKMLAEGVLPTGYLDLAAGKLFLTEMGYRAPQPEPQPRPEPMTEEQEDDILQQIRKVNDDIPDEVMSAKIDRIEEITGKILAYQKARPEKAGQLRSFLNYYLPTTLKILRAYAQLDAQGIEGENISAAKARIEGMMDQVVAGFEKQLDKLFRDDAMDINSDVQVLENMLKKDGLSGDDSMTMTL